LSAHADNNCVDQATNPVIS